MSPRSISARWAARIVAASLLLPLGTAAQDELGFGDTGTLDEARQRLQSVDESLRLAEERRDDLLGESRSLSEQLEGLQAESVAAALAIRQHEYDLKLLEAKLAESRRDEAAEQAAFEAENDRLSSLLGVLARLARLPAEPMILGEGDPNSQVRTALTARSVIAEVETRTTALREQLERLTSLRAELEQRTQDAERARRTLNARVSALDGIIETRRTMLESAEARRSETEDRIGQLTSEVGMVAEILNSLEAEAVRRAAIAALDPPVSAQVPPEPEPEPMDPAVRAAILALEEVRPPTTGISDADREAAIEALAALPEAVAPPEPEPEPQLITRGMPWRAFPPAEDRIGEALDLLALDESREADEDEAAGEARAETGEAQPEEAGAEPDAVLPPEAQVAALPQLDIIAPDVGAPESDAPGADEAPAETGAAVAPLPGQRPRLDRTPQNTATLDILTPVSGDIMLGFGDQDPLGQIHKGLTIGADRGLPVLSPMDGTVRFAGPFQEYGRLIIIEHDGGYHSLVAGLGRIDVAAGQRILSGEPIGATPAPQTTASSTVEIYFELRQDGVPINPIRGLTVARQRGEG